MLPALQVRVAESQVSPEGHTPQLPEHPSLPQALPKQSGWQPEDPTHCPV